MERMQRTRSGRAHEPIPDDEEDELQRQSTLPPTAGPLPGARSADPDGDLSRQFSSEASAIPPMPRPSGDYVPRTYKMNRNGCFELYLQERGFREAERYEKPQVGHWDVYKTDPIDAQFDSWPRTCTNVLDNIWTYYRRVCACAPPSAQLLPRRRSPLLERALPPAAVDLGLADDFPQTIFEWRNLTEDFLFGDQGSPVWFLKNIWGVHGKGITLITDYRDYREKVERTEHHTTDIVGPDGRFEHVPDQYFLQRGVVNPHLVDWETVGGVKRLRTSPPGTPGKKYILRTFYCTLGDGRVYLYNDCLGYIHAVPFEPGKNDWNVHVSHFKMWNGEKDTRTYFTLSDLDEYPKIFSYMVEHSKKHSLIWADVARKSWATTNRREAPPMDATRYQVWGTDYLVMEDMTSYLLGLNAFPNLNHHVTPPGSPPRPHEHEFRKKGFDRDLLRILGVDDGGVPPETPLTWVDVTHASVKVAGAGAEPEPELQPQMDRS